MRLEELLRHLELARVGDTQKDDRDIAGDAIPPECALPAPILKQYAGGGTSGGVGVNQSAGELRIDLDFGFGGTEFAQSHIIPGEVKGMIDLARILIFLDERQGGVPGFRHTE